MRVERDSANNRAGYSISATQNMAFKLGPPTPPLSNSTAFAGLEHAKLRDNAYLQLAFRYRFVPIGKLTKVGKWGA
jgi:hypothetical protein